MVSDMLVIVIVNGYIADTDVFIRLAIGAAADSGWSLAQDWSSGSEVVFLRYAARGG